MLRCPHSQQTYLRRADADGYEPLQQLSSRQSQCHSLNADPEFRRKVLNVIVSERLMSQTRHSVLDESGRHQQRSGEDVRLELELFDG